MALPLSVTDANYNLADHAAWHAEIDTLVPFLGLPDSYSHVAPGTLGHLKHHGALNNLVDDTLGTSLAEYQPGHYLLHERTHAFLTTTTVVNLTTASNVPAALSGNPTGTVFGLAAGTYRLTGAWTPRSNQRLHFAYGAVVNGAAELTGWTQAGSDWWTTRPGGVGSALPDNPGDGNRCAITGCRNPNDVFVTVSGVVYPLVRASSLAAMAAGTFFEDFAAARVYVRLGGPIPGSTAPADHLVEQAIASRLVLGGPTVVGVRLENGIFRFAANAEQTAAVDVNNPVMDASNGWLIDKSLIQYNHGAGVVADGSTVRRTRVHHQGQLGCGGHGIGVLYEDVESDHNNRDGAYAFGWEGGGSKFVLAQSPVFRRISFHDNQGPGWWCDIRVHDALLEDFDCRDNAAQGVFYEISYAATIRNGVAAGNAPNSSDFFYTGGQVLISASPDCEVANVRAHGRDGIGALSQLRPDDLDPRGPHEVHNLHVHDCNISLSDTGGTHIMAGIANDEPSHYPAVFTSRNNRYGNNRYYGPAGSHWAWDNGARSFAQWQGYGLDATGSFDTNPANVPPLPAPPVLPVGPRGSLS